VITPALGHDFADATEQAPKTCKVCGKTEGEKLPSTSPEETPDTDTVPEKDHGECETQNLFDNILNAILNFFRSLLGLPEKCICGEELK
jgi:hypothetical protein